METSVPSLCDRFGLDQAARASRLALLQLGPADHDLASSLHEQVIRPHGVRIIEGHHRAMMRDPVFAALVRAHSSLRRLERLLAQYLATLGQDFDTEGYFATRLRVGVAHARLHVPVGLYVVAYRSLAQAIIDHIPPGLRRDPLVGFVYKITSLDMSLAVDAYHRVELDNLQRSVESARAAERHQRTLARRDSLTGLVNRRSIEEHLLGAIQRSRATSQPLSIIMADLDHFKLVNDTYGHGVGDQVLRHVSDRMQSALRESDWVGRYGGEEFVVVLGDAPAALAAEIAERIRVHVLRHPIRAGALTVSVSVSQGVATLRPQEGVASLIRRADEALYAAKAQGRNCVVASEASLASVSRAS